MTPVPKANPEASFRTGHFEPLSETPSERATCPRVHREAPRVIIPGSLRMRHVSPEDPECAASDTSSRELSECDATLPEAPECAESPANDIYSGCPRMRHVSPEAPSAPQASRKLPSASRAQRVIIAPEASERDTCPRVPLPGDLPRILPSPPRGRAPRAPPGSSPSGPSPENPLPRALGEYATCPRE